MKLKTPSETVHPSWLMYDVNAIVECIQAESLVVVYGNEPTNDAYKILEDIFSKLTGIYIDYKKLEKNFKGKPLLPAPWSFSLSNTDTNFLLVVAKSNMLGIDLESPNVLKTLTDNQFTNLMESALAPLEQLVWKQHPTREHFLRLWTLKEAYLKATGVGLVDNLDRLEVIQTDTPPTNRLCLTDTHFDFLQFSVPNEEIACLVFHRKVVNICLNVFFVTI
jgi:phosphopantetheine--protein transferase-like protein